MLDSIYQWFSASIVTNIISILALFISIKTYFDNQKSSKVQSHYQKGSYRIFLGRISWLDKILGKNGFNVKLFNSLMSNSYPFPFKICITPNVGGIARAQTFEIIRTAEYLGTSKTTPEIRSLNTRKKKWLHKDYAYHDVLSFIESEKFPYFSIYNEQQIMSRFHFCIEITDFCNNTEIWYVSFSLLVDKDDNGHIIKDDIIDINIVSPKDLIENLDSILEFECDIEELKKEENFENAQYKAQLFEMKEYYLFLRKIKENL